jgi:acetyl esterase
MTLHPQVEQMLARVPPGAADAFAKGTPAEARAMAETFMSQVPRPDVHAVDDRTIAGPGGPLALRVYRPNGWFGVPVVVFFHGSGFCICSLETHDAICRRLALASGCVVVSVDYRLAPEHPFPAAIEDCWAATGWVADHEVELGVDATRLAVVGDSAGGNLATVTTLVARERGGPPIAAQVLAYPCTDAAMDSASWRTKGDGSYLMGRDGMRWYWDHYLQGHDPADPLASPLRAPDLAGLPPALVVTGEYDPLCDEGRAYAERLAEAGVPTVFREYEGMLHAFLEPQRGFEVADEAMRAIGEHLRQALGLPSGLPTS